MSSSGFPGYALLGSRNQKQGQHLSPGTLMGDVGVLSRLLTLPQMPSSYFTSYLKHPVPSGVAEMALHLKFSIAEHKLDPWMEHLATWACPLPSPPSHLSSSMASLTWSYLCPVSTASCPWLQIRTVSHVDNSKIPLTLLLAFQADNL